MVELIGEELDWARDGGGFDCPCRRRGGDGAEGGSDFTERGGN